MAFLGCPYVLSPWVQMYNSTDVDAPVACTISTYSTRPTTDDDLTAHTAVVGHTGARIRRRATASSDIRLNHLRHWLMWRETHFLTLKEREGSFRSVPATATAVHGHPHRWHRWFASLNGFISRRIMKAVMKSGKSVPYRWSATRGS